MTHPAQTTIQVRIDQKTKKNTQYILNELGLDLSTAVKMLCKQIELNGTLPFEIRDVNGFSREKAQMLRDAIHDAKKSKKTFHSARALLEDVLK